MFRVAMRCDGGNLIGMGHIVRNMALYLEFEKNKIPCIFIIRKDQGVIKFLREKKLRFIFIESDTLEKELLEVQNIIVKEGIDVLITDSYSFNEKYLEFLKDKVSLLVSIDDNYIYDYPSDIVINPNIYADIKFYNKRKDSEYLLGKDFIILRDEFCHRSNYKVEKNVKKILVTMGGSDVNNFTKVILSSIRYLEKLDFKIILGSKFSKVQRDDLKNLYGECKNIDFLYNPNNMKSIMEKSHIAISSSGGTAYELASLGVPTILIVQAENQISIAKTMERKKAMINLGYFTEVDENLIITTLKSLIKNYDLRKILENNCGNLVSFKGAENIVSEIKRAFYGKEGEVKK